MDKLQNNNNKNAAWGKTSMSFWLAGIFSVALIGLGVNGFIQPLVASKAFGLEIIDPHDQGFVRVKAARDLVLGLTIGIFLILKMQKSLFILAMVSAIVPLLDGILVLTQMGGEVKDSWQHFITMAVVLLAAYLIKRERRAELWN